MAHSATRRLIQIQRMCSNITTANTVAKRYIVTAHSIPSGYNPDSPDLIYGSRTWRWLRPCSPVEADVDDWNMYGSRLGMSYLTFNSDQEITQEIWEKMATHLNNQMPCLRNVVLPHNSEKWICQVEGIKIPVEVIENGSSDDVIETMFDEPFVDGAWGCKVVKAKPDQPCLIPEEKESKPFQYNWHFVNHHGMMDGHSNALMIRIALDVLNALLAGIPIDDTKDLVHFRGVEEVLAIRKKIKESLENDPIWFQREKERLFETFKPPLLNEAFPAPKVSKPRTARLIRWGNDEFLNAFQNQCKLAGVSVTNGLVALINTAIVEMVKEAGVTRDTYHLTLNTNVDTRRYMSKESQPQLATGMLVSGMHQCMYPPTNVREEFWEHAKSISEETKRLLKTDGTMVESVVREFSVPSKSAEEIFSSPTAPTMTRDFSVNNLKDLTSIMYNPKRHKHVAMTGALITSTLHNFNPMMFSLCSYRGNTFLLLEYGTNVLSKDTAEDLMERVVKLIGEKSGL